MAANPTLTYTCINCGAEVDELYRRYSPTVLKIVKCENCGNLADKYVEYDPVIVFVDMILLEKPAYRHLLFNTDFHSYWKLMIVLILGESFRKWSAKDSFSLDESNSDNIQGERDFYVFLAHTILTLGAFLVTVITITELKWIIFKGRPNKYSARNLARSLTIGGCAKLLEILEIVWQHIAPEPHYVLTHGYTILCLLTAYSVVCESGRLDSLIGLAGGLVVHNYVYNNIPLIFPLISVNDTLMKR